ncbi:hypothetical protein CR969_00690 [Candidatus Saccharibacteria bacterium]|nr:MAG: hypothetical protein CR969_00690 [Candidatus Saccharibacteria bacterium]
MRVGLFTDTYRPTINGITFVVETLRKSLEAQGHEVYIFCPAKSINPSRDDSPLADDDHIVRFSSVPSGFFDDFDFTLFFPPKALKQIKELELDVIHVFTPSQIGLLGVHAAVKNDVPFIMQHSTDLYEFIEHYPNVLPGILALAGVVFPMSIKMKMRDYAEVASLYRPSAGRAKWGRRIIERGVTLLYSKADAVITLSRKSYNQLKSWQRPGYEYDLTLLPNGVDAIKPPTTKQLEEFKKKWGIRSRDEVYGFVGRLGEEKNLTVLIKAFNAIGKARPRAKLMFVGDFDYREALEELASKTKYPDRIIFTGAMPREELGVAYATFDVFAFPSLKDTQGWVLHEAAHAKLPIVMIDRELSEVVIDGESGYLVRNSAAAMSRAIIDLLSHPSKREKFGKRSKQLASRFTEKNQTAKVAKLYQRVIDQHSKKSVKN